MTTVFVLIREHNVLDKTISKALYKASYVCKLDHLYFIPYTHCFSFAFGGDQVAYMQTLHMSIFGSCVSYTWPKYSYEKIGSVKFAYRSISINNRSSIAPASFLYIL